MSSLDFDYGKSIPLSPTDPGQEPEEGAAGPKKVYTLGKQVGVGSYSTVHYGEYSDGTTKTKLACKVFDKEKAPPRIVDRFFPREIQAVTKVKHPNIVGFHSIVLDPGPKVVICMELAENGNLLEFIMKNGPLPESQARIWFKHLVRAVRYLHARNVAHRDLKCENILISEHWNLKLADFGFARSCVNKLGDEILCQSFCGSPAYAAPEVVSGTPYRPKIADVWSLGVIFFAMLNGTLPFQESNLKQLLKNQLAGKWEFRERVKDKITPVTQGLVRKILEPNIMLRMTLHEIATTLNKY